MIRPGGLTFEGAWGVALIEGGGTKSSLTPKVFKTVNTLPIWQVGLPFSRSMMKRSPVPEVRAKDFWVTPRFFLAVCTICPMSCGAYFMVSKICVKYYRAGTVHPRDPELQRFITER